MKIIVEEIANLNEVEVIVKCKKRTDNVESIVDTLRLFQKVVSGKKEEQVHLIRPHEIFYFDSVDNKVFCYTKNDVFETKYKLYELEQALSGSTFLRVNKSLIVNVAKIASFKFSTNGKMEATLQNMDKIEISRNYVSALKVMLGGLK